LRTPDKIKKDFKVRAQFTMLENIQFFTSKFFHNVEGST